jgi:hypothetical protein
MSDGKISVADQTMLAHVFGNIIKACESVFSKGLMLNCCIRAVICNIDHASLNGIVIPQLGRLFKGMDNCCPEWNDRLTMYGMEFTKNKLYYFITQVAQKYCLQEMVT